MKKLTEEKQFLKLMKSFGISITQFTQVNMIQDEALADKAVTCYDVLDNGTTFNFNDKGRYVGANTIYALSYQSRSKKPCK